jgi:WhiB family redox-sensing transcriptional regulator
VVSVTETTHARHPRLGTGRGHEPGPVREHRPTDLLARRAAELDVVVGPWPAAAPHEQAFEERPPVPAARAPRPDEDAGRRPGTDGLAGLVGLEEEGDEGLLGWQERALCAQTDPEAFFPEKGGSTREAKKVCVSCDVRAECLEYALLHDERFGIWGGLSERERRKLKKRAG